MGYVFGSYSALAVLKIVAIVRMFLGRFRSAVGSGCSAGVSGVFAMVQARVLWPRWRPRGRPVRLWLQGVVRYVGPEYHVHGFVTALPCLQVGILAIVQHDSRATGVYFAAWRSVVRAGQAREEEAPRRYFGLVKSVAKVESIAQLQIRLYGRHVSKAPAPAIASPLAQPPLP